MDKKNHGDNPKRVYRFRIASEEDEYAADDEQRTAEEAEADDGALEILNRNLLEVFEEAEGSVSDDIRPSLVVVHERGAVIADLTADAEEDEDLGEWETVMSSRRRVSSRVESTNGGTSSEDNVLNKAFIEGPEEEWRGSVNRAIPDEQANENGTTLATIGEPADGQNNSYQSERTTDVEAGGENNARRRFTRFPERRSAPPAVNRTEAVRHHRGGILGDVGGSSESNEDFYSTTSSELTQFGPFQDQGGANLIREQDQAFLMAVIRERKAMEAQEEMERQREENRQRKIDDAKANLEPEPPADAEDVSIIRLHTGDGFLERRFSSAAPSSSLYVFIASEGYSLDEVFLETSEREAIANSDAPLTSIGLSGRVGVWMRKI